MGPPGSNLKISELGQDFFELENFHYCNNGFFVDIGASDGFTASNTFVLEKFYNWHGICVDPNPVFVQSLYNARNSVVSNLCVYNETGKILPFKFYDNENGFFGWNLRSGLKNHIGEIDQEVNKSFKELNVLTITLNDLLLLYNAPREINYISLDTEGSEYEILKVFNFEKYNVNCFTVEYSDKKEQYNLENLFKNNNYITHTVNETEVWAIKNSI